LSKSESTSVPEPYDQASRASTRQRFRIWFKQNDRLKRSLKPDEDAASDGDGSGKPEVLQPEVRLIAAVDRTTFDEEIDRVNGTLERSKSSWTIPTQPASTVAEKCRESEIEAYLRDCSSSSQRPKDSKSFAYPKSILCVPSASANSEAFKAMVNERLL